MEYKHPSSAMAYEQLGLCQRQYAPVCRPIPPQHNSSVPSGILPDFSIPPPTFIPNCKVPPPPAPHGFYSLYPTTSSWDPNSEIRYSVPFSSQPVPESGCFSEEYFQGPRDVQVNSLSTQPVHANDSAKDREWIKRFIRPTKKLNKCENIHDRNSCVQPAAKLKIFEAKLYLEECQMLLKDLENLERHLIDKIETLSISEWNDTCDIIETKKKCLEESMHKFSDCNTVKDLRIALMKRGKKRAAMKRRRIILKEEKMSSLKRRHQLHLSIDSWLEEMQQSVEKVKQEESLKQQADIVLSDVTRKKAEARRQLTLLSMLLKLRRIRVQTATNRGEHTSLELVHIFENVIEKLQKFWSDQLKDYNLEEKGLRVMLEEGTEDNSRNKKSLHQRIMSEWQKVMFGKNLNADMFHTVAERDVDEFVKIRREWDKFVVPSGVLMASPMPVGWVLPVKPSSEQWEKLLGVNWSKH